MNVTPESDAPIIPNATKYQGLCLFPVKKVSESVFLDVRYAIKIKTKKYDIKTVATNEELIIKVYKQKDKGNKINYGKITFILEETDISNAYIPHISSSSMFGINKQLGLHLDWISRDTRVYTDEFSAKENNL